MADDMAAAETIEAMQRLQEILRKMHPQADKIVTGQAVIEDEIMKILRKRFINPATVPNLKAIQAIALLEASTTEKWALLVLAAARAFTELRNEVAHPRNAAGLKTALTKVLDAMERIGHQPNPATVQYGTVAIFIIAALHIALGEGGE
jgi:hypothetical protein